MNIHLRVLNILNVLRIANSQSSLRFSINTMGSGLTLFIQTDDLTAMLFTQMAKANRIVYRSHSNLRVNMVLAAQ